MLSSCIMGSIGFCVFKALPTHGNTNLNISPSAASVFKAPFPTCPYWIPKPSGLSVNCNFDCVGVDVFLSVMAFNNIRGGNREEMFILCVLWLFSLVLVANYNMVEAGFMTYTVASHQEAIRTLWLHFWGTITSSIFIYSLWMTVSVHLLSALTYFKTFLDGFPCNFYSDSHGPQMIYPNSFGHHLTAANHEVCLTSYLMDRLKIGNKHPCHTLTRHVINKR